jgi:sarcosine oxidase, subunit beta
MSDFTRDVLIVGAGVQGCAIALFLARAGRQVTVFEKGIAGRQASGVNAGGLRRLMRDLREYPLSCRAMELWDDLQSLVGDAAAAACEVRLGTAQIALAMSAAEWDWCQSRVAQMHRHGHKNEELIDTAALRVLLPGLSGRTVGGLISRGDGHANPAQTARAFRLAAAAAGAKIIEHCPLRALWQTADGQWHAQTEHGTFTAGQVVNCAGAWGAGISAMVGENLPLEALALSMMVTVRVKPFITPVVIGIDQPLSFKQSTTGSLVIGGGIAGKACLGEGTSFTVMDRMTASAAATIAAFPVLATIPILRTWTGLEGKTPDGIPYIGPSQKNTGLWHVFGFSGHGFQLAPAVGEAVTRALITGRTDPMLVPFAPGRFAAGSAA